MSKWNKISIGEFIDFNPSESIKKGTIARKIPMDKLGTFQRKINGSELSEYSSGPKFRNGDTLVAKITPCLENGKTALVDILNNKEVAFGSSEFIVLRENKNSDKKFIYYLSRSPLFRNKAISCMEGTSGRKRVNEGALKTQEILVPDLPTQQKIASVLSALDDKIELNNRINAELEAMAKTLYDYWFVQFDFPVASTGSATEISGENVASTPLSQQSDEKNTAAERSQETVAERSQRSVAERSRGYKSSGGKMVYNETLKREIPEGWEVKKMSFFEMYQPQTISEKELNNNHKYYVFGANGIIGKYDKFNHLDSEIVVTCRGNSCGNIIRTLPESWITGNAMVIKSIEDYIESEFIFQMLNWIGIKKVITGSGQPQITRVNLETLDFVLPKRNILSQFNELVRPIVEKKLQLFKQNQELSALRNWLLPMLMNGQVKVG